MPKFDVKCIVDEICLCTVYACTRWQNGTEICAQWCLLFHYTVAQINVIFQRRVYAHANKKKERRTVEPNPETIVGKIALIFINLHKNAHKYT